MSNTDPKQIIEGEVSDVLALQSSLEEAEEELAKNTLFQKFLKDQKEVTAKITATWKNIEDQMIAHKIKSIKGGWGSITITERTNYEVVDLDLLPNKFIKKVPDTTKISTYHKLEDKLPKGVEISTTKYITKRIK